MLEKRVYNRRVDYLRIVIKGTPDAVTAERERFARLCEGYPTIVHGRSNGVPFKTYPLRSPSPYEWTSVFEAWGRASDEMAKVLTAHEWHAVTRCDWREEVPYPPLSLRELEDRARAACQGGIRITTDDSRVRHRRNGRDGGGQLLGIGSHASDTRLTLYKRGDAEWAVEAQLSGKQLAAVISTAAHEASQEPHPTMYSVMQKVMFKKLRDLVQQRLAMPYEVLAGIEGLQNTAAIKSLLDLDDRDVKAEVFALCATAGKEATLEAIYQYWREYWRENTARATLILSEGSYEEAEAEVA